MRMTETERLLGIMLAEMLEGMGIHREIDPTFVKTALLNHDEWSIPWKYSFLQSEEPVSDDEVAETASILSMMSYIEYSVETLASSNPEFANESVLRFQGFDGNNDRHHGIADTMINELDRFSEFKNRNLNSHSRGTLSTYRRIKSTYDDAMLRSHGRGLTADDLRAIVAASHY